MTVSVSAEVLEADAPAGVSVTGVSQNAEGWFEHGVEVTWEGAQTVRLDDARFTHHLRSEDGDLITLGRGCGFSVDEATDELQFPCTADLQLILVEPGMTHEYPVSIPSEAGSFRLQRGTYVVEEGIHWWQQDNIDADPTDEGQFTIRLTYEVE